jgi:hypothetical protein
MICCHRLCAQNGALFHSKNMSHYSSRKQHPAMQLGMHWRQPWSKSSRGRLASSSNPVVKYRCQQVPLSGLTPPCVAVNAMQYILAVKCRNRQRQVSTRLWERFAVTSSSASTDDC